MDEVRMKAAASLSPEEARFQRQLVTRIKRGEVSFDAQRGVFYDTEWRYDLHADEQAVLVAWRTTDAIHTEEAHVLMGTGSQEKRG